MTFPSSSGRFPPEFEVAFRAAGARGELFIPSASPHALKCKLWAFQRALRKEGKTELADSIQICPSPGGLTLKHRSLSKEGLEVSAALSALEGEGDSPPPPPLPSDDSLERFLK